MVELRAGRILVDGVDTRSAPLSRLRKGVTLLSQDPLFFSGTLRDNLDPLGAYREQGDAPLLAALRRVRMDGFAAAAAASSSSSSSSSPLDMRIDPFGANLSSGQQQLLALARALLDRRGKPVVVADEITAALSVGAEGLVNALLRSEVALDENAGPRTVIEIAHRVVNVIDADQVLVLAAGVAAEVNTAWALLQAAPAPSWYVPPAGSCDPTVPKGLFSAMVCALPTDARNQMYALAWRKEQQRRRKAEEAGDGLR
jgi:ABC-type multidrug transport system fused ATPase/permease subunit